MMTPSSIAVRNDTAPAPPAIPRLASSPHRFHALDGLRGVAAAAVLLLHIGFLVHRDLVRSAYLGVDLFFSLSGFVIAYTYGDKLARGLGLWPFLKIRLIRLYPVYFAALVIGAVFLIAQAAAAPRLHPALSIVGSIVSALAFLPTAPVVSTNAQWIFPINIPAWSLFFELVASLVYGAFARRPGGLRLPLILAANGLALILAANGLALLWAMLAFGNVDFGPMWLHFIGGFPRAVFAFFTGVLALRIWERRRLSLPVPPMLWLALLAVFFCVAPRHVPAVEMTCVFLAFPSLVFLAASTPATNRIDVAVFEWLGRISYPVYAIQGPILLFAEAVDKRSHVFTRHALLSVPALFAFVVICAALVERCFDLPMRSWLRRAMKAEPSRGSHIGVTVRT